MDLDDPTGRFRFNSGTTWANQGGQDANAALHGPDESFPWRGQALAPHVARLVSVVLGAILVCLTIALGWLAFPQVPAVGILAGILGGTNPQFLFISGSVNNDNLTNVVAAGLLICMVCALLEVPTLRLWCVAAMVTVAGLLTNLSIGPVVLVTFAVLALRSVQGRRYGRLVLGAGTSVAIVAAGAGWWFVRNQLLYGDPVGWTVYSKTFATALQTRPFQWSEYAWFFPTQYRSFWGVFGWMTVEAPAWFYGAMGVLCLLAGTGWALWLAGRAFLPRTRRSIAILASLALAVLAHELYLAIAVRTFGAAWFQGRYLFPILPAVGVFLSAGLMALVPPGFRARFTAGVAIVAVAVATWMLFGVIAPAYAGDFGDIHHRPGPAAAARDRVSGLAQLLDRARLLGHQGQARGQAGLRAAGRSAPDHSTLRVDG